MLQYYSAVWNKEFAASWLPVTNSQRHFFKNRMALYKIFYFRRIRS